MVHDSIVKSTNANARGAFAKPIWLSRSSDHEKINKTNLFCPHSNEFFGKNNYLQRIKEEGRFRTIIQNDPLHMKNSISNHDYQRSLYHYEPLLIIINQQYPLLIVTNHHFLTTGWHQPVITQVWHRLRAVEVVVVEVVVVVDVTVVVVLVV